MNSEIYERSKQLLGDNNYKKIEDKCLLIFGLGGVGGTAFECLLRSGFKKFILVDFDKVSPSNLNRQILYTYNDIDKSKVLIAKNKALSINKDAKITVLEMKISRENIDKLNDFSFDYIIDAIDDVSAKIAISKYAYNHDIPLIISLGMANRINPSDVIITRLDKTSDDPLARKFRYELKKEGLDTKNFMTVFSKEKPFKNGPLLSSMMMVPSSAGLAISAHIINYFINL